MSTVTLKTFMTTNLTALKDKTHDIDGLLFKLFESLIISTDRHDSLVSTEFFNLIFAE